MKIVYEIFLDLSQPTVIYLAFILSPNPVDIISFGNVFRETDTAQGMIFKGYRTGIHHNFTMCVDPSYKNLEKKRGGVQWFMMESMDFVSEFFSKQRNKN